jgi:hypothetical protein
VVILTGVTAAMSHASVWAPPREGVGYVSELLTVVVSSFAATFATGGALLLWLGRTREAAWRSALPATIVVAVLVSLLGISRTELHLEAPAPGVERINESESGRLGTRLRMDWRGPAVRNGRDPVAPAEDALPASPGRALFVRVLLTLAGVSALVLAMRMRGAGRKARGLRVWDAGDDRVRAAARAAIVHSIDAMLADSDDRTAIIGAYARLLEELEAIGASRRAYEGPTEHLRRVLGTLEVGPRPLRTLVRLFEVARFSEHSLSSVHRHEALAALREAADSLTASTGSPSAAGVAK